MAERKATPEFVLQHEARVVSLNDTVDAMRWLTALPHVNQDKLIVEEIEAAESFREVGIAISISDEDKAKYVGEDHPLHDILGVVGIDKGEGFKLSLNVIDSGESLTFVATYSKLDHSAHLTIDSHSRRFQLVRGYTEEEKRVKLSERIQAALQDMTKYDEARLAILNNTRFFARQAISEILDIKPYLGGEPQPDANPLELI